VRRNRRHAARARSFGAAAAAYQRGRPPYPAEAVDWLLAGGGHRVLDLGAGTGKLTRQLCDRGLDVVAVEPSARMREQLAQTVPEARILAGTAEQIPLPDRSLDAVLVAQAWHWVDAQRAVPQVARVLTPGGRLGLLWNVRDERHEWVAALGRIMRRHGDDDDGGPVANVGRPFGPIESHDVAWRYHLTPDAVLDLVASRSYVITLAPEDRAAVLDEVRDLFATHPAVMGRQEVELPYVTKCFRAQLR
jgi:SAM-dependent methyltransferase